MNMIARTGCAPLDLSFEYFPPKTAAGAAKLPETALALQDYRPSFFSVTYGAGGTTQEGTLEAVQAIGAATGVPGACHLTCVGA
ncbi:MAG: methylenetetrahydrofolate reductase, partial [Pseudomonadota bacterium]|nr:methylenetetrahydrofolate reductase [Pseudomonadota bacterium]